MDGRVVNHGAEDATAKEVEAPRGLEAPVVPEVRGPWGVVRTYYAD
jgi:hypothetical protein